MTRKELLARISIDPGVCFGKPCIRGHRIWVPLVLDLLSSGRTVQQLLEEYPGIEEVDVRACIAYGAEMSRQGFSRGDSAESAVAFQALLESHPQELAWLTESGFVDRETPISRQP